MSDPDLSWYDPAEHDRAQVGELHFAAEYTYGSLDRCLFIREQVGGPSMWRVVGTARDERAALTTWNALVAGESSDRRIKSYLRDVEVIG